jgi:ribosomal peptide maturation radical SAM protein 1
MPFAPSRYPALGLTMLKGVLSAAGFRVTLHYATVRFARLIGTEAYNAIAESAPQDLVGDWVFADTVSAQAAGSAAYADAVLNTYENVVVDHALAAHSNAERFVDDVVRDVLADDPQVVGFTSTFAQSGASLAAARAIKALRPSVAVMFGGANCEGEMAVELVRRFPFVDAVVSGEGEAIVAELVERLARKRAIDDLPGVYAPGRAAAAPYRNTPTVTDLDALPLPDFSDFFAAHAGGPDDGAFVPELLVEASRGCWWGEKHHCTFCGLNGTALGFRSKSPERFVDELQYLVERYGTRAVAFTDNILDYRYFRTALPMLARRKLELRLFFEIKANLRRDQVATLAEAGVRYVQPGIESLDTGVLRLMRKGVTALQNVQLLRLCAEHGICVAWNLLFGFPDEDPQAYSRMAAIVPLLTHLQPPDAIGPIRLDRFSPLFDEADTLGVRNVRPARAYAHVYGEPVESLAALAYYFDFDYADGRDVRAYTRSVVQAVREWQSCYTQSDLCTVDDGAVLLVIDRRPIATSSTLALSGIERFLYAACDDIQTIAGLTRIADEVGIGVRAEDVLATCRRFVDAGLMLEDDGKFLSLAVALARVDVSSGLRQRLAAAAADLQAATA